MAVVDAREIQFDSPVVSGQETDYPDLLPQLMHFALLPYLGPQAAEAELAG